MSLQITEDKKMKTRKWGVLAAFVGVFLLSCAVGSPGAEAGRDHWGFSLGHGGGSFHYGSGRHGHRGHHGHGYHGGYYGHGYHRPYHYGYGYYPRPYYHSYHYYPIYGYGGCW